MQKPHRNQTSDPQIKAAVFALIKNADGPMSRDQLVGKVHVRVGLDRQWSFDTTARRVREAFNDLAVDGVAIVSQGKGFRLAKTQAELDAAATRLWKQAMSLLRRQAAIKKLPLQHVLRQIEIDWGAE